MVEKSNVFIASLGLAFAVIGCTWYLGTTLASEDDVKAVNSNVEALVKSVNTIQATLPLLVSCVVDLGQQYPMPTSDPLGDKVLTRPVPDSCAQARDLALSGVR